MNFPWRGIRGGWRARGAGLAALLAVSLLASCGGGSTSVVTPPLPMAQPPTFWPLPGQYSPVAITFSDVTAGATLYYTTDGSTPTHSSKKYTDPITVSATTSLQAIAVAPGFFDSVVTAGNYTIVGTGGGPQVAVTLSTDDQKRLLQAQAPVAFSAGTAGDINPIAIDEGETYQQVEGFGAAFTDSATYLLHSVAPAAARDAAMKDLFTRNGNGIGLSFMRIPMGASDIARSHYSYDDLPAGQTDPTLAQFSIAHDQADILPIIQQAKQLNPQLKLMANPWSPPGWMKSSGAAIGGSLLPEHYTPYANYFVKFVQAYGAAGVPIDYISLQNEPLYVPGDYPGMCMPAVPGGTCGSVDSATDQTTAVRDYMLPAFAANGITAKLLLYDHNWDAPEFPEAVLSDPAIASSPLVAGVAWHGYGGAPGAMNEVHNLHPALGQYETEHSLASSTTDPVRSDFEEIIQNLRNWARSYVKWSLALDQNLGPHTGGCGICTAPVTVNSGTGAVSYGVEYATLGQFSRYLLPGATHVYSNNGVGLPSAAFVNPDGTRVLVIYNDSTHAQGFTAVWGGQSFTYTLPALAGATFIWSGTPGGSYTLDAKQQVQASSYRDASGLRTEGTTDTDGGYDLGYVSDGAYAHYGPLDFGSGVGMVNVRSASNGNGGTLEFHLDAVNGPLIATAKLVNTGGWQTWQTSSASVSGAAGTHEIYVVFHGVVPIANLNWFRFQ